jgi:hypothetical protein
MPVPKLLRLLPPAAAYAVVRLAYAAATGTSPWALDADTFARWDSGNYADIAARGYQWASCAAQNRPQHGDRCSTAAWYPAYPYLARAVAAVGRIGLDRALVLVAHLAFVALLTVVWLALLDGRGREPRAGLLLGLTAFFPGGFYLLGAFPLSLLVLLLVAQVACFVRGRWWAGAVAGALAGLCYPITAVLPAASVAWVLIAERAGSPRRRLARAAGVGAVVATGTVAVLAVHQLTLGDWSASLAEQERFGGTIYNPVLNWGHAVVRRTSWIQLDRPVTAWPIAAQTLLVTVFMGVCAAVVWRYRNGDGEEGDEGPRHRLGLLVYLLALWIVPLASTIDTGLYRRVLPLVPGVWLLRKAPGPVVAALTVASVALWWWMAPLFANGELI